MPGRLPPELIDQVLSRVDIVDVVGTRISLKKAGSVYKACCPFHNEKTPSFTVSPTRQTYHCFGCGVHDNAIGFLMEHDRLSFREAVEELAVQAGVPLPDAGTATPSGPDPRPLYQVLEKAAALYRRQLRNHPERHRAVDYLRQRGLTGAVAQRFGLGYAPPGWDLLLRELGGSDQAVQHLHDAGLIKERDKTHHGERHGGHYDRFRDRVIFPIRDRRGRVVGLGGRVLGNDEPKYLNSPETTIFHKGRELYGLYESQQAMRKPPRLLVVEGYMDVIALAQFEIPYAVATLGTATTTEHVKRLLRSAPELVFCFDGDRAGRDAAWKALKATLPEAGGQQAVRFLFLPDGEDPDSLVRKEGRVGFEQRQRQATLLSDYLFERLTAGLELATTEGRAALDAAARPLLAAVPAGTFRTLLEQRLAAQTGLRQALPQGSVARTRAPMQQSVQQGVPAGKTKPLAREAIALLLDNPALGKLVLAEAGDWREIEHADVALLIEVVDVVAAHPAITAGALRERWRGSEQASVVDQLSDFGGVALTPEEGREAHLTGAIQRLNREAQTERRYRSNMEAGARHGLVRQPPAPVGPRSSS